MLAINFLGGEHEGGEFGFHGRCPFLDGFISYQKDTTCQASKQASKQKKISLCGADF
jgi:hypothetical protein